MHKISLCIVLMLFLHSLSLHSQLLKVTGGASLTRNSIDAEVLSQVIRQKQEEVFNRLLSNIIVKYFAGKDPEKGVFNFATYYSLYNLVTDITVGKSKTTVSKAVINSAAELAYMYAFVKFYQQKQITSLGTLKLLSVNKIENAIIVSELDDDGRRKINTAALLRLNYYLDAAFDVLAQDDAVQKKFYFQRPITSSEVKIWYESLGLKFNKIYKDRPFKDVTEKEIKLADLINGMKAAVPEFLAYVGKDPFIKIVSGLEKPATGFEQLKEEDINKIKLMLLEFGKSTDYLFDQNVVKTLVGLIVENTHFGVDEGQKKITRVYIDVESLILSLDKIFVAKNKKSSMSSGWFWVVNPRPFLTIGSANGFFLNPDNRLNRGDGPPTSLKNINLASEKIGIRVKVYDGGYTHAFGPGEVYTFKGNKYVWTQPQKKPLVSSVYYNVYASGLLYNILNLKTNQNFDFGYLASNVGVIFFNGLELSAGVGFVYEDGLDAKNSFFKIDFDVPIIDYLSALKNKNKGN